jgi:hypothetical protein
MELDQEQGLYICVYRMIINRNGSAGSKDIDKNSHNNEEGVSQIDVAHG